MVHIPSPMFAVPPENIRTNSNIYPQLKVPDEWGIDTVIWMWYTPCMTEVLEPTHTVIDVISAVQPSPIAELQESPIIYPPCTMDEDTFALAVIETSGNIAAAYRMVFGVDSHMPLARGKELLSRPQVALRIREITDKVQDAALISVGAHLNELADIRDLAKQTGQLKTALAAERSRGEAVGIYQKHDAMNKGNGGGNTQIMINLASKYDVSI